MKSQFEALSKKYDLPGLPPLTRTLVICVLPASAGHIKSMIKRWGDVERGVATQVVIGEKIRRQGGALDQYW